MKLIPYLTLILLLISCGSTRVVKTDLVLDTVYQNRYAEKFLILGSKDSLTLRVFNPWQGAQAVSYDYTFPKDPTRQPRIVCMSSSHVAYLDAIGACENIVGVSGVKFITNPKIRLASVPDVGYDNNLNYELVVALKPDYLFVYEVAGENSATTKKLEQLGIPIIYIADYLERTPLARSEWLIAFGAIMGRMDQSVEFFEEITDNYIQIRDSVAKTAGVKPKVMLNSPYRDVWYVPGDRSYLVQLIRDAGGDYLAQGVDSDISRPIGTEVAYELLSQADIWLNPGGAKTLAEVKNSNPRFNRLSVVLKGEIYNNNARSTPEGGSDFWESGSLRADIILKDMSKIFNPNYYPIEKLYYFHRLQ